MFVRIVHHWVKPGQLEAGRHHIDRQGEAQSRAPGFEYRYRMEPVNEAGVLTTLTAWESEAAFEAFRSGRTPQAPDDPGYPFARVEHQAFNVLASSKGGG
jgi:heme-degrading monooxygenase HmoA